MKFEESNTTITKPPTELSTPTLTEESETIEVDAKLE